MSRCPKTCCYALVLVGLVTGIISGAEGGKADQESIDRRVEALLKKMTLEEKFGQLLCYNGRTVSEALKSGDYLFGSIARGGVFRGKNAEEAAKKYNEIQKTVISKSRLGIPFIYHEEALHGLLLNQGTTYPQAIGLAASWNPQLVSRVAAAIAEEARARGVRQVLAPVINIARDVRWGRVEETFGEDPYLTSRLAVAYCREFESRGVVSTPKHFAANVGDGGRDSNIVHFSERILREVYFPAFRACVQEAGARSIMAAYNALDGIPCNAHPWLLTDVLRKEWGFRGFVVSDYVAVPWMIQKHRTAATKEDATAQAVIAGLEVECPHPTCFKEGLPKAVKNGLLPIPVLDEAVRRVLRVKFEIGLFDHPYADPEKAKALADCAEFRALAREACRQSIVLLKNKNRLLPLDRHKIRKLALIGPLAGRIHLGGYSSGHGIKIVSLEEGIRAKIGPQATIRVAEAATINRSNPLPSICLRVPGQNAETHGLRGEYFANSNLEGKPVMTRIDREINFSWGKRAPAKNLPADRFSVRWTGKLVVPESRRYHIKINSDDGARLYLDGKLVIDNWQKRNASTSTVALKLEKNRSYDIRLEYYDDRRTASVHLEWDGKPEWNPRFQEALAAARTADVAVIVCGIEEGEFKDRSQLSLSPTQEALIRHVSDLGVPTVVLLETGSAVTMSRWIDDVDAILQVWYPGEEGGNGIADVLFGDYNPGGKLPITFPKTTGQCPLYYNYRPSGRVYDYVDNRGKLELFPFGFGLSYTTFAYSDLAISNKQIRPGDRVRVSFRLKNTGKYSGHEVVQLYLHDLVASVSQPVKVLRRFQRVKLDPGEEKTVNFELGPEDFTILDRKLKPVIEPGEFDIMIGSSSADIRLRDRIEIITP